MKERIFIISPLSEDEEEKTHYNFVPYDEQGNTTAMAYYDEQGNTIESDYQEQPEEETTTIENRIIIIYEAPKIEVATQQNQARENTQTIATPREILITSPYPQPEIHNAGTKPPYSQLLEQVYGEKKPYGQLLEQVYGEKKPYGQLLEQVYGGQSLEQSPIEQNQLTSIRSELQEIMIGSGAPAPQAGELAAAA